MAPAPAQTFLFINKHASSSVLSRSEATERSRILSHVRAQEQRTAANSQPWKLYTDTIDPTENRTRSKLRRRARRGLKSGDLVVQEPKCAHLDSPASVDEHWSSKFDHNDGMYAFLCSDRPSYNSLDPFHCTVGGRDVTSFMHLAGYSVDTDIIRITWGAESLKPLTTFARKPSPRHYAARIQRLKDCVDNKLLLHSSIAHGSSSRAWINGDPGDPCSRLWVGRTLQTLQVELADPDAAGSYPVVMSIFSLALTALWNALPRMWLLDFHIDDSHFATCRIHILAMLEVVDHAGGWEKFAPYVLEGMILVDKAVALLTMTPPLIPLTFDPGADVLGPGTFSGTIQDAVSDLATGFRDLEMDPTLAQILIELGHFYHIAVDTWQAQADLAPQRESHFFRRFQAFYYRLLLLKLAPDDWTNLLIQHTSLVVLCNITLYSGGLISANRLVQRLRGMMEKVLQHNGAVDEKVWLWCLCTGATTRLPVTKGKWFIDRLRPQIVRTGISSTLPAIRKVMRKYLYFPWLQDSKLEAAINGEIRTG